ncbi:MAG: hypothetical protein L0H83_14780, partial [Salinisphaera sp.]|nr:hypothetical protein [Salinisphaera sp.]
MRRTLLVFFIFLLVGVGLALLFREHSGYVQLAWGNWRLETSLLFFLAALAVAVWILILVWRTLMAGARLPARLRGMLTRRRERKAQRSLHKGLLLLFEGRWADAERTLLRHAARGRNTGINYLSAAHAAQRQDAAERRDRYIEQAAGRRASSELAVLLTQASLQMQQGQDAEALATLARLRETHPEHPPVVTLLADLCERVGDWAQIRELLPVLRKLELVSAQRWRALAVAAWGERLTSCENEPS